jgi:hypothetical protein
LDGVLTKQSRPIGIAWIAGGGTILLAGVGVALLNAVGNLLIVLAGVGVGYVGLRTVIRGRRHFVRVGLDSIAHDPRPPVLYLRPFFYDGVDFQVDPATINRGVVERGFWRQMGVMVRLIRTNEQLFARAFRDIGPLVAIGDPREALPRLGAVRVYAREGSEWQEVVADLAERARYVILEIGVSEGVLWEVDFITRTVRPDQLILSLPNDLAGATRWMRPGTRERRRQENYAAFRDAAADEFPVPLPDEIGRSKLMYFESDWTPRPALYHREIIAPFGRRIRHPEDPKLEALIWINSILF